MTLTLELPSEIEAVLTAQAQAQGMTLPAWLAKIAAERALQPPRSLQEELTPEEWVRQFDAWVASHDRTTPLLSEEAISRESIYADRIQRVFIDTSILARTLQPHHPSCLVANKAIDQLRLQKHPLHLVPQNLVELWVVATRPVEQNGLGMSIADVLLEFARLKSFFIVLPETQEIYPAWERLVSRYQVSGKPAHDARLVAAMQVHGIKDILTFDRTGFTRFADLTVLHPEDITSLTA